MATKPRGAGALKEKVTFRQRKDQDDGYGNTQSVFQDVFTTAASYLYLRGGEAVIAARLVSQQPVVVRVRDCAAVRDVEADWRIRDDRSGKELRIRTITPGHEGYVEMLCQES